MKWKGSYLDIMGMDESHMDLNEDLKENYLMYTSSNTRTLFSHCFLLEILMKELLDKFGTIPLLPHKIQPLNHILKNLPRSEVGFVMGNWSNIRPALIQVFRKIDFLSHPDDLFDDDEPALEEATFLEIPVIKYIVRINIKLPRAGGSIKSNAHSSDERLYTRPRSKLATTKITNTLYFCENFRKKTIVRRYGDYLAR
ncbi:hypothetical protein BDC45DRAFT_555321 [Circinella umbellata]|nr:hypothetical protein BDC45DRAFT_555321 [Circinella umbellata]